MRKWITVLSTHSFKVRNKLSNISKSLLAACISTIPFLYIVIHRSALSFDEGMITSFVPCGILLTFFMLRIFVKAVRHLAVFPVKNIRSFTIMPLFILNEGVRDQRVRAFSD